MYGTRTIDAIYYLTVLRHLLWLDFDSSHCFSCKERLLFTSHTAHHHQMLPKFGIKSYHTNLHCIVSTSIVVSSKIRRQKPRKHCEARGERPLWNISGKRCEGSSAPQFHSLSPPFSNTRQLGSDIGKTAMDFHSPSSYYRACSWTPKTSPNDVTFQTAHCWFW